MAVIAVFFCVTAFAQIGRVGINTTTPAAMLHVKDSSVVFTGSLFVNDNPPISGLGARMMWYASMNAFRTGRVSGTQWDKANIGQYSFATGFDAKASGFISAALGSDVIASGDNSMALGYQTIASGSRSTSMGSGSVADGNHSTAMGTVTRASGNSSASMGNITTARAFSSLSIGRFNDSIASSSIDQWIDTDPLFIIGNGLGNGTRNNAFIVLKNAKTGINTSSPLAMLHVKDSSVLFTGASTLPVTPGNPPVSGAGTRMMWYPDKAAFRAGGATDKEWDKDSTGNYSFAAGVDTKAKGTYSIALGRNTSATGNSSIAMGEFTNASGFSSIAIGSFTNAIDGFSTAIGFQTTASGDGSTAMGASTISSGVSSTTMGTFTKASGNYSTAMSFSTNARAFGSLSIGSYNDSIATSSTTAWVATDPVFIIGNGTADNARSNAITILKNAKTGINTETPAAGLHIKAIDNTFDQHIRLESTTGPSSYANILYDGSLKCRVFDAGATFQWRDNTSNTRMQLTSTGNLSIDGTLTQNSDARLKRNIHPLQNSLKKIISLNGYQYNWIEANRDTALQTGVLAQQIEQQMPELVKTDEEGIKSVNYNGMIPYLIEAVKELKQENENLKEEIKKLKNKF